MPTLLLILIIIIATYAQPQPPLQDKHDDKTALPFDLMELVEWQDAIDRTEKEDDGRYKELILSKNKNLEQLIGSAIYPQDEHAHYFALKNDKIDCSLYITISSLGNEVGLYYNLINIKNNKIVGSLPLGALLGEGKRKTFIVTKNLEITLFDEKYFYDEKKDSVVVTEKKKTAEYQIQRNCQIVKDK